MTAKRGTAPDGTGAGAKTRSSSTKPNPSGDWKEYVDQVVADLADEMRSQSDCPRCSAPPPHPTAVARGPMGQRAPPSLSLWEVGLVNSRERNLIEESDPATNQAFRELDPRESAGFRGPRLLSTRADQIVPAKPDFLWDRWLAHGALHLLIGRQGGGKSTLAVWLIAQVTTGRPYPDDTSLRLPVNAAVLSLEESADRVVGRLRAAQAEVKRVEILGSVQDFDNGGIVLPTTMAVAGRLQCSGASRRGRANRPGRHRWLGLFGTG